LEVAFVRGLFRGSSHIPRANDPDVSTDGLNEPLGPLCDLVAFYISFMAFWTVAVLAAWKFGLLPEPAWRWFRTAVWIGAVALWMVWQHPPEPVSWLALLPIRPPQVRLSGLVFGIIVGWNFVRANFLSLPLHQLDHIATFTPGFFVWSLIGVFIEELLFRGVVQTRLTADLAPWLAILVTTVLFFAIHIPGWIILSATVGASAIATVVLVGLICGVLRYRTGSLWPGVSAHWANNLGAML
jgi:membrane protease YdiL (CAAX protease family)